MAKYQLPKEFLDKWVEALRSGKYKQGRRALLTEDNCYCCLGVAANACGVPDKKLLKYADEKLTDDTFPELPLVEFKMQSELIRFNDEEGKTFLEIADWLTKKVQPIESEVTNG